MELQAFLTFLSHNQDTVSFQQVMDVIDSNYHFTPTQFSNGELTNEAGQNNGSCKIFAFAELHQLDQKSTLACFGDFYRKDVLEHPAADDHQNIRNFIRTGWQGIQFSGKALLPK